MKLAPSQNFCIFMLRSKIILLYFLTSHVLFFPSLLSANVPLTSASFIRIVSGRKQISLSSMFSYICHFDACVISLFHQVVEVCRYHICHLSPCRHGMIMLLTKIQAKTPAPDTDSSMRTPTLIRERLPIAETFPLCRCYSKTFIYVETWVHL